MLPTLVGLLFSVACAISCHSRSNRKHLAPPAIDELKEGMKFQVSWSPTDLDIGAPALTKKTLAGLRPPRAEDAHGRGLEADTNFFLLNLSERGHRESLEHFHRWSHRCGRS